MKRTGNPSGASLSGAEPGRLVSTLLTGSWRESPPPPTLSADQLTAITLPLCQSGSAALAWWRIRHSALAESAPGLIADTASRAPALGPLPTAAAILHQAYRRFRLSALIHEREIKCVFSLLRAAGIEAVLVKGWAIARRYPDRALRPYGDIDLCVRPDQFTKAAAALKCLESKDGHYVDLHDGFAKLEGADLQVPPGRINGRKRAPTPGRPDRWQELFERSQLVDLGEEKIRVLSDEDHLRVLCLHLLRSGAWRPLWLCDVALVLESRATNFDWDICLTRNQRQADWIAGTIGLAHHLLGVDIQGTPVAERAMRLPRWLLPAVLRQWDRCRNPDAAGMALPTLLAGLSEPKKIFSEWSARWDNPVRATVALRGQLNDWPRLPYQLAELIRHTPEVPRQVRLMFRERVRTSLLKRRVIAEPGAVEGV